MDRGNGIAPELRGKREPELRGKREPEVERRDVLIGSLALPVLAVTATDAVAQAVPVPLTVTGPSTHLRLRVNGREHDLPGLDPRTTLLDALRDDLDLTGTKPGCQAGRAAPAPSSSTDGG